MNLFTIFVIRIVMEKKNFSFFKKKKYIFLLLFYLVILVSTFLSNYNDLIIFKSLAYIRYIFFIFAVSYLVLIDEKILQKFLKFLFYTLLIVIIDGYFQYFFGKNILGFEKIRHDRISGFFDDKLVLGSYLLKFTILHVYLFLKNIKNLDILDKCLNYVLIFLSIILIFITGDRAPGYLVIIFIFIIFISMNFKYKFIYLLLIIFSSSIFLVSNNILYDRFVKQTLNQINFTNLSQPLNSFKYYSPIFNTAYSAFKGKIFIGHGPKSFRYFCSDEKYEYFFSDSAEIPSIGNIEFDIYNPNDAAKITKLFIKEGDDIKNGQKILSYIIKRKSIFGEKKIESIMKSSKSGKIIKILVSEGDPGITKGRYIVEIKFDKNPNNFVIRNSCTTHPHNFYLQLLSETGLIGTFFIIFSFLFFLYKIITHIISNLLNKKNTLSNSEIILIAYIIILLFPFTTTGNFFNNWLNMISILPISLYLFESDLKNEIKRK